MAQLKSLSINGKDLTNSLTQTASTTVNLENVYKATTATIKRRGDVCMVYCVGRMTDIINFASWNEQILLSFPTGYKPISEFVTSFYCDGENEDWTKNYFVHAYTDTMKLVTRGTAYVGGGVYTAGQGFWFSATYVTADDWPA